MPCSSPSISLAGAWNGLTKELGRRDLDLCHRYPDLPVGWASSLPILSLQGRLQV